MNRESLLIAPLANHLVTFGIGTLIVSALGLVAGGSTSSLPTDVAKLPEYNTAKCHYRGHDTNPLNVYLPNPPLAHALLRVLCADPVVSKSYGNVVVRWRHELEGNLSYVANLEIYAGTSVPRGLERTHAPVLGVSTYSAVLLTRSPTTPPDCDLLGAARIGLLSFPGSQSGNQTIRERLGGCGFTGADWEDRASYYATHSAQKWFRQRRSRRHWHVLGTRRGRGAIFQVWDFSRG